MIFELTGGGGQKSVYIHWVLYQRRVYNINVIGLLLCRWQWRNLGPRRPRCAGGRRIRGAPNRRLNVGQFRKLN